MSKRDILKELRTRFPFYLMGKKPNVIKAVIYYLENDNVTYRDASKKFGCTDAIVQTRAREIRRLLKLPKKARRIETCFLCGSDFNISQKHFIIIDSESRKFVGRLCTECFKKETEKQKE